MDADESGANNSNNSNNSTWAPQSPDLSGYYSQEPEPLHTPHQAFRGSISHASGFSGIEASSPAGAGGNFLARAHSITSQYSSPTQTFPTRPAPRASFEQHQYEQQFNTFNSFNMPRGVRNKEPTIADVDPDWSPEGPTEKGRGKRPQGNNNNIGSEDSPREHAEGERTGAGGVAATTVVPENITIKNHFPVARIKRIMQADDDVGKVAQVTPVVVSKALELFMISLVTAAASEARARNSKRVAPIHLKQVVVKNEQFDFLSDIVARVPDAAPPPEKGGDAMEVEGGGAAKKKRAKRGAKKGKEGGEEMD